MTRVPVAGNAASGKAAAHLPAKQLAAICVAMYDAGGQSIHLPLTASAPFIQVAAAVSPHAVLGPLLMSGLRLSLAHLQPKATSQLDAWHL